ncbi:uncharacterized protein LOC62_05G007296 [Vanrija pseudolonga]|uniref:Uncharacterized protein n=1 Tax=Vanrija pseudolonga TaxID=143232 RepID=A0AAF1BSP9_9TREE|nr:hypothetical protein LOC62_05G007296 [Vanrija pseudolonga]
MDLRPRVLVLRNMTLFLCDEEKLWDWQEMDEQGSLFETEAMLEEEAIDSVERLVCVLTDVQIESSPNGHPTTVNILRLIGQSTTDVTFVFWSPHRHAEFMIGFYQEDIVGIWLQCLAGELASSQLEDCAVTFVNAGAVWWRGAEYVDDGQSEEGEGDDDADYDPDTKQRRVERWIRSEVADSSSDLNDETAARRQDSIRFLSMGEYLAEPGVLDVFDPAEIAGWL